MDFGQASLEALKQHTGALSTVGQLPLESKQDLSVAYTPGVAEACRVIHADPDAVWTYTLKGRTVAVVTDGSAVLGLGDIGPEAGIPVMEGKAMLFKRFGGLDAFPIALATQDVNEIIETVIRIAPTFGAINLEDIAAPRCFEIERALIERLDIPVMHDDQHGTAVVMLAGLYNAVKLLGKDLTAVRVVISGAGAAGIAVAHMLHEVGVQDIVLLDSKGILVAGREGMNPYKEEVAPYNVRGLTGDLASALVGAEVFIGLSGQANAVTAEMVQSMASEPIIFALSNPTPDIEPAVAKAAGAAVVATGRSDLPNQVNNALAFPGIFRGAFAVRARAITMPMKLAAARAIADTVKEVSADEIIPSPFEPGLAEAVAQAVAQAA